MSGPGRDTANQVPMVCRVMAAAAAVVGAALLSAAASAGEADVIAVNVSKTGASSYDFDVTVIHADTGWDHYANKWEVVGPDGKVIATRVLYHPHVGEQPFTRSLTGVRVGEGVKRVTVRAHDKVHGYGGRERLVVLPE